MVQAYASGVDDPACGFMSIFASSVSLLSNQMLVRRAKLTRRRFGRINHHSGLPLGSNRKVYQYGRRSLPSPPVKPPVPSPPLRRGSPVQASRLLLGSAPHSKVVPCI